MLTICDERSNQTKWENPSLTEFQVVLSLAVEQATEPQAWLSSGLFLDNNITNKVNSSIKSHTVCDSSDTCQHVLKEKSLQPLKLERFLPKGRIIFQKDKSPIWTEEN